MKKIRALLTPAELPALRQRDLSDTLCVVFDVLRATSTFITALHQGAEQVIPVSEISDALAWREKEPDALLAGERNGVKIGGALTGGRPFDLGNSPREFIPEVVRGKTIVATTTNGTRALNACQASPLILAGALLNLTATARFIGNQAAQNILLVCAGTGHQASLEDILTAGALCESLHRMTAHDLADSAVVAWRAYRDAQADLAAVFRTTDNGRRLLTIPELSADVAFCARADAIPLVVIQRGAGLVGLPG